MACETGEWDGEAVDFVDGVWFREDESYLTIGRFVAEAPYTNDYTGQKIFYRSLQTRREDYLTTHDYLWRWDPDWFWCSRAFGAQNRWAAQGLADEVPPQRLLLEADRARPAVAASAARLDARARQAAARERRAGHRDPGRAAARDAARARRDHRHRAGVGLSGTTGRATAPGRSTR